MTGYLSQLSPNTQYHYRLVAQNSFGTTYGYDYTLTTPQATATDPAAAFAPPVGASPGASATFDARGSTDAGASITDYTWDFGDGTAVTDAGPSATITHTFANRGKYNVTLLVTNDRVPAQADSIWQTVTVDNAPSASFTAPANVQAPGTSLGFNGSASTPGAGGSISGYSWDFGDGSHAASGVTANHAYASTGVYNVALTVTDDLGVTSTKTDTVIVDQPNPLFTPPQTATAPGSDVQFDASGSTDPEGSITDYSWNFGDGSPIADGATPTHAYTDRGKYTVTLTITNGYDQTESIQHTITVDTPPTASFTAPTSAQKPGDAVTFDASDSTSDGGSISGYSWDFGDGSHAASGVTANHAYASTGVYNVALTVTDDLGVTSTKTDTVIVDQPNPLFTPPQTATAPGSDVQFDASGSTDPEGSITDYSWNFGDGSPIADGATPTHAYTDRGKYTVTLTITNGYDQTESIQHTITVDTPPTASFTAPTSAQKPGDAVTFDASDSTSDGGSISGYSWDFGDGSPAASGVTANHAYASTGVYNVTLTVTDDLGVTSTKTDTVIVDQPNPLFTPPQTATAPGSDVQFDASGSTDPEGRITDYSWNFGDGSPIADGATPTHAYTDRGKYTVTLTITNGYDQTESIQHTITVDTPPTASFTAPTSAQKPGDAVTFDASDSTSDGGSISGYSWHFGDGPPAGSGETTNHIYSSPGTYPVTLAVTDDLGVTSTKAETVIVDALRRRHTQRRRIQRPRGRRSRSTDAAPATRSGQSRTTRGITATGRRTRAPLPATPTRLRAGTR